MKRLWKRPPPPARAALAGIAMALAGIATALTASSCLTYDGNRAIVPLLEIYSEPAKAEGPSRAAAVPATSTEVVLRPLGSFEHIGSRVERAGGNEGNEAGDGDATAGPSRSRVKVLWPLGDFAWGQGDTRLWTLPIFYFRRKPIDEADGGGSDVDWTFLPFFFGGKDPREGAYFALFPVAGKINGLLAKDVTWFVLFPLYFRWWEGEYDSMHLVAPFFNRVRGGGYSGWRFWPLYGHYESNRPSDGEPRYRRTFVLWPFFIRQSNNLDSKRPTELIAILPFYGKSENVRTRTVTYGWPFFHKTTDLETGRSLWFGWIIPYRVTEGQVDIWPLFGWKRQRHPLGAGGRDWRGIGGASSGPLGDIAAELGDGDEPPGPVKTRLRQFALWPIQRYDATAGDGWSSTKHWFLPLFWSFSTVDPEGRTLSRELKLWPLARYRSTAEKTSFVFPSPLWFRQESLFERLYARLWRVFLYKSTSERAGWEFLWGTLSHRREIAEDESTISVFYGLLEWTSSPGGPSFRLLYLPWR